MRKEEANIAERVSAVLDQGEEVEAALTGSLGTLRDGGYYATPGPGRGIATDPYDVVLTTRRLLAFPSTVGWGARAARAQSTAIAFECDRSTGHVAVVRKLGLWSWVVVVFHDRELRLLVSRRFRESLAQMCAAAP
jgi:hypothetical protein